jgi:hypothetical protein
VGGGLEGVGEEVLKGGEGGVLSGEPVWGRIDHRISGAMLVMAYNIMMSACRTRRDVSMSVVAYRIMMSAVLCWSWRTTL